MGRSYGVLSTHRPGLARTRLVDFQYLRALGYTPYGGAAIGEVLHAVGQAIRAGSNREAAVGAWTAQGRHLTARAERDLEAGSPTSARERLLRAYDYLRVAEFLFDRHQVEEHRALSHEGAATTRSCSTHPGKVACCTVTRYRCSARIATASSVRSWTMHSSSGGSTLNGSPCTGSASAATTCSEPLPGTNGGLRSWPVHRCPTCSGCWSKPPLTGSRVPHRHQLTDG